MNVLLVGVGLIGGSFSLSLKEKGLTFGGCSRKKENLQKAEELGITSVSFPDLNEGIRWADWIILSIPVNVITKMLPGILDQLKPHQLVVDFGSTKGTICEAVKNHPHRAQFLACHPIAGTEHSGPEAAFTGLFEDKVMILCEEERSDPKLIAPFYEVMHDLKFRIVKMGAMEHDRHLAYISHLSHITSFALSNTVLRKEQDGEVILELAGSGFASTVRLAKSSPEMWTPIFMENKKMVLESLARYSEQLQAFRQLLESDNTEGLTEFLENGRQIRRII